MLHQGTFLLTQVTLRDLGPGPLGTGLFQMTEQDQDGLWSQSEMVMFPKKEWVGLSPILGFRLGRTSALLELC